MRIETDRLVIRDFEERDAERLYDYLANPPVRCFLDEKINSYDEALRKIRERQGQSDQGDFYAVCLKNAEWLIGEVFWVKEEPDTYSIGWNFNLNYGGKGYATEAVKAAIEELFRGGTRRIYAYVEEDNLPSQRLCDRLGMRREGLFLEFISFINNPDGSPRYENTYQYAILKREWLGEGKAT